MQAARDALKEEAIEENCNEKHEAFKRLRNKITAKLEKDQIEHYKNKFYQEIRHKLLWFFKTSAEINTAVLSITN